MVSLRFPFPSFPPPPGTPNSTPNFLRAAIISAASAAGIGISLELSKQKHPSSKIPVFDFILTHLSSSSASWGSFSLSSGESSTAVESKTGATFPSVIRDCQALLGVGLRRKCVFGLKNIDVYAFGVYVDEDDVQKSLKEKYGKHSAIDLKANKDFNEDLLASDINITVRLQIVYSKLSIRSVRSAFEESVGSRLQKFGGSDNKELFQRFTSQFSDDLKIPKNSVIELSRDHGHVLHTIIDGQKVGSIQSKLLCRSVLDLYVGEDPFDQQAKENIMLKLAHVFENNNAPVG